MIRSPIVTFVGHVDHGKTSVLDFIRKTTVVSGEAGKITQAIGASIIPAEIITKTCGDLLKALNLKLEIPGLLFVDTPGHEAFTTLRKRGGNLADIAILVVDINEGFKPQTEEAVEILKSYKTPFIVAANKLDLIPGWKSSKKPVLQNIQEQDPDTLAKVEEKLYELVGRFHELGFESERFDRVKDYTKQIALVPTSAQTGEGIPELLMVLTGLVQKYFENKLDIEVEGPAKGTVLEVKEEKGLGTTIDVIIYNGSLKQGDTIVIGGMHNPIVTKIKALLQPAPLAEMRTKQTKFKPIKEVFAATGVKISAPELDKVISGMPVVSAAEENIEQAKQEVQSQIDEVLIETDDAGIIIKADNIGSLEALNKLLKDKKIPIRKATIGNITKKDVKDAETNYETDPLLSVIIGFNIAINPDAEFMLKSSKVKALTNTIIYKLIEDFELWQEETKKSLESQKLDLLIRPCKIQVMPGYIFRQSNPAGFGVDVLTGSIKTGTPLMTEEGKEIGTVKGIQAEQENIEKAESGKQVALSVPGITIGRQADEGHILYSSIPEQDFRKLKELKQYLSKAEIEILKQIAEIKRRENPVWGI